MCPTAAELAGRCDAEGGGRRRKLSPSAAAAALPHSARSIRCTAGAAWEGGRLDDATLSVFLFLENTCRKSSSARRLRGRADEVEVDGVFDEAAGGGSASGGGSAWCVMENFVIFATPLLGGTMDDALRSLLMFFRWLLCCCVCSSLVFTKNLSSICVQSNAKCPPF